MQVANKIEPSLKHHSYTKDFSYVNHGSIVMLTPISEAARAWCAAHLPEDCSGLGNSFGIRTGNFGDILDGITDDGLEV